MIKNPSGRKFLEELLLQIPREGPIKTIQRCIPKLIKKQGIDIQRELPTGEHTYYSLLRARGVSAEQLDQISFIQQSNNKFYILDMKTKAKYVLPLIPEHVAQLIAKFKDSKFYEKETFEDNIYYHLSVTFTNTLCHGKFVSGSSGFFKKEVRF